MSRGSERLFEAMGLVRDELVDEALKYTPRKKHRPLWLGAGAVAAALVLAVGVGTWAMPKGGADVPGTVENGGTSGCDGSTEFMSYAGPVFPLTLTAENGNITAQRTMTLDFSPWTPRWVDIQEQLEEARELGATQEELEEFAGQLASWYPEGGYYEKGTDLLVEDTYLLTNAGTESETVEVLYPYASSLRSYQADRPALLLEGVEQEGEVYAGPYAGGFRDAGPGSGGQRLNLDQPSSWTDYETVLTGGDYQEKALSGMESVADIPVTLYTFTDAWGPERSDDTPNPSIRVMFDVEDENTKVLSYGFHMGWSDDGSGRRGLGFSIREAWRKNYGEPYYLIILGGDLENMEITGYNTGGWDTTTRVESGVTVDREETDLDTALRLTARLMYQDELRFGEQIDADFELYYRLMLDELFTYGILSEDPVERYEYGWQQMMDFEIVERIFYVKQEVTIPAQSTLTLTARMEKEASFDFHCAGTENRGVSGYDAVTTLGSVLTFTGQRALLEDRGQVSIVRENFGFDLEQGIKAVELDLNTPHYYLEVKRLPET